MSPHEIRSRLTVQELTDVWQRLSRLPRLRSIARIQRGFEWEGVPLTEKDKKNRQANRNRQPRFIDIFPFFEKF